MAKQVFLCGCKTGHKISEERVEKVKNTLEEKNIKYTLIEDLCGTVIKNPEAAQVLKREEGSIVIGCHPRAMEALLLKANIRMCCADVELHHNDDAENAIANIEGGEGENSVIPYDEDWVTWFPIIDYSRCTGCQKCLNFCLFGVYKNDNFGNVLVDQPANCKDMCPACARTCPEQAIIFPKHEESPIDGGEGEMEAQSAENIVEQLQNGDDVYNMLAKRRKSFGTSLLKEDQQKLAEEERACCATGAPQPKEEKKEDKSEKNNEGRSCCC